MSAGVYYCGPVEMSHKDFCLYILIFLMTDWPGGSYLVMDSTPIVPDGIRLLAIGYKYNYSKIL